MHHLYGAVPEPYAPVRVTRGVVITYRYTYDSLSTAELLFFSQCLCATILVRWCDDGVGLAGFKSKAYAFLLA